MADEQKDIFVSFCKSRYGGDLNDRPSSTSKSKTISQAKGQKIVNALKNDPVAQAYSPKFRHWVRQRSFKVMSCHALGLKDVLCLPARNPVSLFIFREPFCIILCLKLN